MSTLRDKAKKSKASKSDRPVLIYLAIGIAAAISIALRWVDQDLSANVLSEIIGAAFTLFVIDVLLVKSKAKRWLIVQEHIDYLIGRTINRVRDGVATRVFGFKPEFNHRMKEEEVIHQIRKQREKFLNELEHISAEKLSERIDLTFFNNDSYDYFDEKAEDIWMLINMKYSEYLAPELVSLLIDLHTNLVDVSAHIRVYDKAERFPDEKDHYHNVALHGTARNLKEIIRIVIRLKEEGYSDAARIIGAREEI
ncbi:MAG: hypothetical protein J7604_15820 [Sporocytophaga sp.]|uniref:hypothetical protein n=1 Tax=Sporocytophaga sp. TaxID=2231183 RepID=UPI001B24FAF9|nr:hypothetical protein [Sporocytophaga sp.]MBO9701674.1 hypothetical protein [Sporocytophaga sp.]